MITLGPDKFAAFTCEQLEIVTRYLELLERGMPQISRRLFRGTQDAWRTNLRHLTTHPSRRWRAAD
jgi:hypothetical protein